MDHNKNFFSTTTVLLIATSILLSNACVKSPLQMQHAIVNSFAAKMTRELYSHTISLAFLYAATGMTLALPEYNLTIT